MLSCWLFRRRLARSLACGVEPEARLARHVSRCARCRTEKRELDHLLEAVRQDTLPERVGEVSWEALRDATVARALAEAPAGVDWRWAAATAATAAALAVMFAHLSGTSPPGALAPAEAAFLDRMELEHAFQETASYLGEGRQLLLGVLSPISCAGASSDPFPADVSLERARSIELLWRGRVLEPALDRPELAGALPVSEDLELVLGEIARLPDCAPAEQLRDISDLVRKRDLLVRLDLVEAEL